MNLGIVIGISKYDNLKELSACYNDANLIEEVLKKSNRFDSILNLYQEKHLKSNDLKERIVNFIEKYKDKEVEELFLYYTGHGMYDKQEFYYLSSDYKKQKNKPAALENSELDTLLKSLSPNLTIKVVDACESGVQYIKGNKSKSKFDSHLEKTSEKFKSCYFMFSSHNSQSSWQNDKLSFFTKSFLDAIINYEGSDIKYKDIIDYISDEFKTIDRQTPFFINQADFTERFLIKTEQIKKIVISNDNYDISEEDNQEENSEDEKNIIDIKAERFILSYEKHGIKRTQIAGFMNDEFDITDYDLDSIETIKRKLNDDVIKWTAKTFEINKEWLNVDTNQIYYTDSYYPTSIGGLKKELLRFIEEVGNSNRNISIYVFKDFCFDEVDYFSKKGEYGCQILFIIKVKIGELNDRKNAYKYKVFENNLYWDHKYSRDFCRKVLAIFNALDLYVIGYNLPKKIINLLGQGIKFPDPIIRNYNGSKWYPDDYITGENIEEIEAIELNKDVDLSRFPDDLEYRVNYHMIDINQRLETID